MWILGGFRGFFSDTGMAKFNEIVRDILKHGNFSEKFSSRYLDQELRRAISPFLANDQLDIDSIVEGLIASLAKYSNKALIAYPVEGIQMRICLKIGNARFAPGDEAMFAYLRKYAEDLWLDPATKKFGFENYDEHVDPSLRKHLKGYCVAIVEVDAEPIRGRELAKEEIRRSVEVLRFAAGGINNSERNVRIGLKGDHPVTDLCGFVIGSQGWQIAPDKNGSGRPFTIAPESLPELERLGVFALSETLQKKQPNGYEQGLIKAIHWFSVAMMQDESGNAFLFLIIALESLFKQQQGISMTGTVSESVAMMIGTDVKTRLELVKRLRTYYGKRSAVAHGGKQAVTDFELRDLTIIVGTTIMIAIEGLPKFQSQSELMAWVDEMKMSGPGPDALLSAKE